jgi:hypothetical protein
MSQPGTRAPRRRRHAQGHSPELPERGTGLIAERKHLKQEISRLRLGEGYPGAEMRRGSGMDYCSFRAQLVFSIGFAPARSRELLHRLLREHAPDDARRELGEWVVQAA